MKAPFTPTALNVEIVAVTATLVLPIPAALSSVIPTEATVEPKSTRVITAFDESNIFTASPPLLKPIPEPP